MSSTTDFEALIAGAARGSRASMLQLVPFLGIHHCSERQIERLITALYIRLDRRHMTVPAGTTNREHFQLALLSLHCLESLVFKDLTCASPSLELAERLTSFWPVIWSWIQLIHSFIPNDKDFPLPFRFQAKNILLSILRIFTGYKGLNAVLCGTHGVVALIFELWHLEIKVNDFAPLNPRGFTTPAALTMTSYIPLPLEGNFDWQNASISAVGGSVEDVAFVAVTHLCQDAQQTQPNLRTIIADMKMLTHLSFYNPLRQAILSQHSVLEVTRVAASLSSHNFSAATSGQMGSCLSVCFNYLLLCLRFGDVWTWTIQSLDGQLLRAILASSSWQTQMDDEVLLELSDAIIKNLTTRPVTLAAARAIKKVRAHGLEDQFLRAGSGPLRQKWLALKELVQERESLIPSDDEGRKNPLKCCNNHMCQRREETEGSFKRCGGCLSSHYCSSLCQKQHWKRKHKSYCKNVQASRQGGAVCPWSVRDEQFMRKVMNRDLEIRHYEVHAAKRDLGLDIVVVEFDYTVVPFKMTVGSLTSCPLNDNHEEEIRTKWDRVLEGTRSMNSNLVMRCLVPTGETYKLMMEAGNILCHCDDHDGDENGDSDLPDDIGSADEDSSEIGKRYGDYLGLWA